jgi:antitoxin (DNA-binding transcriptional repressor) of toxin-antitoxin stability system
MGMINVHEAKTTLSKLLDQLERGEIENITIARNGHPVAVLSPAPKVDASRRIGIAEGLFPDFDYETFKSLDKEIEELFLNSPIEPSR